jgi:hypothetical protein
MPLPHLRFTVCWLMEATIIAAIALWSLRFSLETWACIVVLLAVYRYGLAPMRQLYGFSPIRRWSKRFANGCMRVEPDGRTGH